MRQFSRHINTILALVLLFATSGWLAVPRDICITKALVEAGCGCAPEAVGAENCPCCAVIMASGFGHCGDHGSDSEAPAEESHSSSCLLVSAEVSNSNGSERVQPVLPVLSVVAVLPMNMALPKLPVHEGFSITEENLALNQASSYRDNCVFLI